MRKVGIFQFQQNFHKELKDLPFIVTVRGKDSYLVTKANTSIKETIRKEVVKPQPVKVKAGMPERKINKKESILFE